MNCIDDSIYFKLVFLFNLRFVNIVIIIIIVSDINRLYNIR